MSLRFVHVGAALVLPPLFTCLKFTDPRGRVCRPHAHSAAAEIRRCRGWNRMRPFGRRSYAVAGQSKRHRPGGRQPEQYALDFRLLQISGHRMAALTDGPRGAFKAAFLLQSKVARHGRSDHYAGGRRCVDVGSEKALVWDDPSGREPVCLDKQTGNANGWRARVTRNVVRRESLFRAAGIGPGAPGA